MVGGAQLEGEKTKVNERDITNETIDTYREKKNKDAKLK